jgi:hypothetical protein
MTVDSGVDCRHRTGRQQENLPPLSGQNQSSHPRRVQAHTSHGSARPSRRGAAQRREGRFERDGETIGPICWLENATKVAHLVLGQFEACRSVRLRVDRRTSRTEQALT